MDADISVIKSSDSADLPTAPGLTFLYAENQEWKESDITATVASDEIVKQTMRTSAIL